MPTLYPVANQLATYSDSFQVQHNETSGEIEYVLIWSDNEMYVTVGNSLEYGDEYVIEMNDPVLNQVNCIHQLFGLTA
ncbi:DUF2848 family protein [Ectobacillus panaciterrae]|uniref:DUF2848 family protein n=1 Tax=Ectobacillus panaciterrae TaxID=363872 RepID=UPI0012DC91F7|nr:DUF2848 family protein [Ectobacillus panaciterrae]